MKPLQQSFPPPPAFVNARPVLGHLRLDAGQVPGGLQDAAAGVQRRDAPVLAVRLPAARSSAAPMRAARSTRGAGVTVGIVDAYAAPTIEPDADTYATRTATRRSRAGQLAQVAPKNFTHAKRVRSLRLVRRGDARRRVRARDGARRRRALLRRQELRGPRHRRHARPGGRRGPGLDRVELLRRARVRRGAERRRGQRAGVPAGRAARGSRSSSPPATTATSRPHTGTLQADYPASDPYITVGRRHRDRDRRGRLARLPDRLGHAEVRALGRRGVVDAAGLPVRLRRRLLEPVQPPGLPEQGDPAGRARGPRRTPTWRWTPTRPRACSSARPSTFPSGPAYGEYRIGGTSLASPLMAGMQALTQQRAGARMGFINPALYKAGKNRPGLFLDVAGPGAGRRQRARRLRQQPRRRPAGSPTASARSTRTRASPSGRAGMT